MTGYQSKRAAALDKLDNDDLTIAYQSGYYDGKKAAQPAQKPWCMKMNGCTTRCEDCPEVVDDIKETLAHPPQRIWVGLTDEMIEDLFQSAAGADEETHIRFARAIETALRSKNNG